MRVMLVRQKIKDGSLEGAEAGVRDLFARWGPSRS
jgi:hypothetical protein